MLIPSPLFLASVPRQQPRPCGVDEISEMEKARDDDDDAAADARLAGAIKVW